MTAAFELTLYVGAAMAAYTPSATRLSSKRSLSVVLASAGRTQQSSCGSSVRMAAAAIPTRANTCRRVHCVLIGGLLHNVRAIRPRIRQTGRDAVHTAWLRSSSRGILEGGALTPPDTA